MSASESVSVSAGDSVNVGVVSDVEISSGGKLVGRVVEGVEVVSGSASLESGSSIDVVSGEDVSVSAGGDMTGYTAGTASLSASSASAEVVGDAAGLIGGAGSLTVGGDVVVGSGGSGSATYAVDVPLASGGNWTEVPHALSCASPCRSCSNGTNEIPAQRHDAAGGGAASCELHPYAAQLVVELSIEFGSSAPHARTACQWCPATEHAHGHCGSWAPEVCTQATGPLAFLDISQNLIQNKGPPGTPHFSKF